MATGLDMSLEDLIKINKKPARGGGGPVRRTPNRAPNRAVPYAIPKPAPAPALTPAPDAAWQHDMYSEQMVYAPAASRAATIETGTKLYISNLDYGVSNEDIKELFSEVGDVKRHSIHYDRSGRSKGTAEVVFSRRVDALAAVKRYNNVQLDGKPMKIEIVGTNIASPAVASSAPKSLLGIPNINIVPRSVPGRGIPAGPVRGGGRGRGRGRGRGGRGRSEPISAADLDADLDKYHTEAMQTN